jgi:hypothetical protein
MRGALVVLIVAAAAPAAAYPQLQLSTGAVRCNQCHYAPAGGGLINNYGRSESADTLSMGGNGGFLHGVWDPPRWLALGADVRLAALVNDVGATEGAELAAFPMQGDVYSRFEIDSLGLSLYLNVGLRGTARPDEPLLYSRLVSREHYLMWRPRPQGVYARVGRFFAPYGLRLAEHPVFVRRFLGFNTLEETYGLSGGYVADGWETHVTAFVPDFIRPVGHRGKGAAAYYERRLGDRAAAGAQARLAIGPDDTRAHGGLVGKYLLGEILLLGQLDLVHQSFDAADAPRWQMAGYLGASWLFRRGFLAQLMLERWDEDLGLSGVARSAVGAELQWFPTAHVELLLYGRVQMIGAGGDDGDASQLVLLQLHYYL